MPSHSNSTRPEILAPAGNADMLCAAVFAGADAVYLGLQNFNARRTAGMGRRPEGVRRAFRLLRFFSRGPGMRGPGQGAALCRG